RIVKAQEQFGQCGTRVSSSITFQFIGCSQAAETARGSVFSKFHGDGLTEARNQTSLKRSTPMNWTATLQGRAKTVNGREPFASRSRRGLKANHWNWGQG